MKPGYVLALGALATLPDKLKGEIFDMEQDNKTITLPYTEYLQLQSQAAQYKATKEDVRRELTEEYKQFMDKYFDEHRICTMLELRLTSKEAEINKLNEELNKYKSRRWWQFWD